MSSADHPTEELLTAFADRVPHPDLTPMMVRHIEACPECTRRVTEVRRGLAVLALASRPPDHLRGATAARRWFAERAEAGDDPLPDTDDDQMEVSGRGIQALVDPGPEGPGVLEGADAAGGSNPLPGVPAQDNVLFRTLDPAVVAQVLDTLEVVDHPAGDIIFEEGSEGDACYLVESGFVRISKRDASGVDETLGFVRPGEFFGELALFHSTARLARASAATPVRLARLDREGFDTLRRTSAVELATAIASAGVRYLGDVHANLLRQLGESEDYRRIGMALSEIAHHLRSPLAAAQMAAALLLDLHRQGTLTPEMLERRLSGIERSAMGGIAYADSLLARLRGESSTPLSTMTVDRLAERVLEEASGLLSARSAACETRLEAEGSIECDVEEVVAALVNLVRNAVEAMPEVGGRLLFATRNVDEGIGFEVTDNGRGIPAAIQHRIFERRFTAGKAGGTGLGLDHVRRVAERHGGRIAFESTEGEGTTFRLWLPLSRPAPEPG